MHHFLRLLGGAGGRLICEQRAEFYFLCTVFRPLRISLTPLSEGPGSPRVCPHWPDGLGFGERVSEYYCGDAWALWSDKGNFQPWLYCLAVTLGKLFRLPCACFLIWQMGTCTNTTAHRVKWHNLPQELGAYSWPQMLVPQSLLLTCDQTNGKILTRPSPDSRLMVTTMMFPASLLCVVRKAAFHSSSLPTPSLTVSPLPFVLHI